MWEYNHTDELYHHGIKGMKWGVRRARRQNAKVDKSFKKWKENSDKKSNAIDLGKKANIARMDYERDRSNKQLKKTYKQANRDYKKALNSNTTYRKGAIRGEVGKDASRKYLSEEVKTVDEAIPELDKYLDDAYLAHLEKVRVVHGRGTGALRNGVHQHLRKLKYVKSFHLGEFGEGDSGVTIVTFK